MPSPIHPYSYFFLASAIICAVTAVLAFLRRRSFGMAWLAILAGLMAVWAFFNALAWLNAGEAGAKLWLYISLSAALIMPVSMFALVLEVAHRPARFKGWWMPALLLIEPVLGLFALWTNDFHHLFITSFNTFTQDGLVYLDLQRGPLSWVSVGYTYLILVICMVMLIEALMSSAPLFRWQIAAFIAGISVPWIANIISLLGLLPFRGLNLTTAGFGITSVIFYIALAGSSRFNLLPMARGLLLEVLTDGLLVMDAGFRFLDVNPAAERLLRRSAREMVGRTAHEVLPHWNDMLALLEQRDGEINTQVQGRLNPSQYFDLKIMPIQNAEEVTGYLVLFRDVTDRWLVEQQIREANRELHTRLTEIEALQQELRALATRDPLTNLYNRRYLEEALENELARAERDGSPIAVIMLDADKFKRINDLHGHKAGDMALQALARIIHLYIRKSDIACRYGGEEFVIVMPHTGVEVARERAEKIREDFRRVDFIGPGTAAETSLSIGIAVYPLSGLRGEEVLDAADQAMYAAKMEGGNRIRLQTEPVVKPALPPDAQDASI